jgi:hypothetical protein
MEKSFENIEMSATISKERCAEIERVFEEFWLSDDNYGLQMIVKNFAKMPIKAKRVYFERRTSDNVDDYEDIKQRIIADNKRAFSEIVFVMTDYVLNPRTSLFPLNVENAVEVVYLKGLIHKIIDIQLLIYVMREHQWTFVNGKPMKMADYVKSKLYVGEKE